MSDETPTSELLDGFIDTLRTLAKDAETREAAQAFLWVLGSYGDDVARLRAEVKRLTEENAGLLFERRCDELAALCFARESFQRMTGSGHQTVKQLAPLAEALVLRLTRERDAAVQRSEADGRVVVKMGMRNREMMAERDAAIERAEVAERERDELLAWAQEMGCEMQADDHEAYTPEECSPSHSGRCWPCEATVRRGACPECPGENGQHAMSCSRGSRCAE